MHYKPCQIDGRWLIPASFGEGRIVIVDYAARQVLHEIPQPANCDDLFSLACNATRLLTAYDKEELCALDIWDVATHQRLDRIRGQAFGAHLETTGRYLVYRLDRGTFVRDLQSNHKEPIPYGDRVSDAGFAPRRNELLIPLRRRDRLVRVAFSPLTIKTVHHPLGRTIWEPTWSPNEDCYVICDSTGARLICCDGSTDDWRGNKQSRATLPVVSLSQATERSSPLPLSTTAPRAH